MTINQSISRAILARIRAGQDPVDALRAVCGTERVDAMIDEIYRAQCAYKDIHAISDDSRRLG